MESEMTDDDPASDLQKLVEKLGRPRRAEPAEADPGPGWLRSRSYYTLRCEICQQMFGIEPNEPMLERSSFDMLMNHAKTHNKTPTGPLEYSRRHPPHVAARTLKYEPHAADTTALRHGLEGEGADG